jgi:alkylhydroperoxidase/carboxymuconolactone decarboxylase family protein YurZ
VSQAQLPSLYTGASRFLQANPALIEAIVAAAGHCAIESTEDIFDARGVKLWARNRPVTPDLLARLADRQLRKPVELCVSAHDPVSGLQLVEALEASATVSPDFARLLEPLRADLLADLKALAFNTRELLLLSVLRFGGRDRLRHALEVMVVACAGARFMGLAQEERRVVLRAALLHDVGELYLSPSETFPAEGDLLDRHAALGALALRELAGCSQAVASLVAASHARLDGTGSPATIDATRMSDASRIISLAEAVTEQLVQAEAGLWRASVTSRIMPGEFDARLVGWLNGMARSRAPADTPSGPTGDSSGIGGALRELHGELASVYVTLSLPFGESGPVQAAAARWQGAVEPFLMVLRRAGVEDALADGRHIKPADNREACELRALFDELSARAVRWGRRLQVAVDADPELASSSFLAALAARLAGLGEHIAQSIPVSSKVEAS